MSIIKSIKQVLGLGPAAETSVWDGTPSAPNVPKLTLKQGNIPNNIIEVLNGVLSFPNQGQSLTSPGYVKFPGGLIIQWGYSAGGNEPVVVSFPIAFPAGTFNVQITLNAADRSSAVTQGVQNITTSQFEVTRWDAGVSTVEPIFWIALGY